MELENLKRWQWLLIGLLVGGLWSGIRLFYGYAFESENQQDGETKFQVALLATPSDAMYGGRDQGKFYLGDIRVYPAIRDESPGAGMPRHKASAAPRQAPRGWWIFGGPATQKSPRAAEGPVAPATAPTAQTTTAPLVNWVTFSVYSYPETKDPKTGRRVFDNKLRVTSYRYKAAIPFAPDHADYVAYGVPYNPKLQPVKGYVNPGHREYPNVMAYLDELNREWGSGTVKYRYAWWESRAAVMTVYPLGGMIVIGGIWPTVLGLLVGAGFGRRKGTGDEYDLSRFKGASRASMPKATMTFTQDDQLRLAELEAEMEKNLAGSGAAAAVAVAEPKAVVRPLGGTAGEDKKPVMEKPKMHKNFGAGGGDYYPTEIHVVEQKK